MASLVSVSIEVLFRLSVFLKILSCVALDRVSWPQSEAGNPTQVYLLYDSDLCLGPPVLAAGSGHWGSGEVGLWGNKAGSNIPLLYTMCWPSRSASERKIPGGMNTTMVNRQLYISSSEAQYKGYGLTPRQFGGGRMSTERASSHSPKGFQRHT